MNEMPATCKIYQVLFGVCPEPPVIWTDDFVFKVFPRADVFVIEVCFPPCSLDLPSFYRPAVFNVPTGLGGGEVGLLVSTSIRSDVTIFRFEVLLSVWCID